MIATGNPQAPFGINNQNQAVYSVNVGGGLPESHAFLYLPVPAYNFTQSGCFDLHDLANIPEGESSAAHDINENGIVVGFRTFNGIKHAYIWRLDTTPHQFIDMGTFPDGEWSEAFAINDDQPNPWIVGMGEYFGDCQCGGRSGDSLQHGFATRLDIVGLGLGLGPAAILLEDPNLPCQRNTLAFDVNTALIRRVAGNSATLGGFCTGGSQSRATIWNNPTLGLGNAGVALKELPGSGSQAQGVSNLGAIVGKGNNILSQSHAVYWPELGHQGAIVDLGSLLPAGDQSWAWRINNLADRDVVGRANTFAPVTLDGAALWECSSNCDQIVGNNWSVTDLGNALISNGCNAVWRLQYAYDVNDTGNIIAWGRKAPWPNPAHAVILVPDELCCPEDLDGNGTVGTSDLLILFANWGDCPNCGECGAECTADLNCDCTVDTSDQLILFANWGPCGGESSGGGDGGSLTLQAAVQQLGFPSLAAHQAWLAQASDGEAFASTYVLITILQDQDQD